MRLDHRLVTLLVATALAASIGGASAAGFQPGDKVEAFSSMTGQWEPATVQSVDGSRYFIHADNPNLPNAYWGVTQTQIRAIGAAAQAAPPPAPTARQAVAAAPAAPATGPGGFKAGDHVEVFSSMTGKWEPATIQNFDGQRYFVHASDPNIANAYWGAMPAQVHAAGAAGKAPAQANQPNPQQQAAAPNTPPAATGNNGKRPEGSAKYVKGADGQTHLVAIIGAGDEMPTGRWKLNAGGQSVLLDTKNNGNGTITETHQWAGPESAGSLSINPDGSWVDISPSGTRTQGRWKDIGQNRVELAGYDGDTWTASTWKGEFYMVNPVGEYEYGHRG